MKTGDPKQAVVLSIVAVGAFAFLGKTLLGTMGGGSGNVKPVTEAVEAKAPDRVAAAESTKDVADAVVRDKNEATDAFLRRDTFSHPASHRKSNSTVSKNDDEKPEVKESGKSPRKDLPPRSEIENVGEFGKLRPEDPFKEDVNLPGAGPSKSTKSDPNEKTDLNRLKGKDDEKAPKSIEVRYEGFVNAGNPVAVIRIGEDTFSVDAKDDLPGGLRVVSISEEKVVILANGKRKTIWLGRTVKI